MPHTFQRCPNFNPGTCKYVTSHGKKDFADMIRIRTLRWKIILDYPDGPNLITYILKIREPFMAVRERGMTTEEESEMCNIAGFEDGGRAHEPRIAGELWMLEMMLPYILQKEHSSGTP